MSAQAEPSQSGATADEAAPATGGGTEGPVPPDGGTVADGGAGPAGKAEGRTLNVFSHGILLAWALLVTLPLIWALISSLKSDREIFTSPWKLPTMLHFGNWSDAWNTANMGRYFLNSAVVVCGSLFGTMLLGAMAAYVLARFEFRGNRAIYFLFVGGMSFPIVLALVPLYFVLNNMDLLGTKHGLILVYIAYSLPFTVFFLTSFFKTLPSSIAEAAYIDGASHTRTFFQVMLPMAKPGLISIGIFNFLGQWNQYMLPYVLNQENDNDKLLPQGLVELAVNQGYKGQWSVLFAGLLIAMLPVLAVYMVFQRQVQGGLTAGALK